jgi:hypothetical protein
MVDKIYRKRFNSDQIFTCQLCQLFQYEKLWKNTLLTVSAIYFFQTFFSILFSNNFFFKKEFANSYYFFSHTDYSILFIFVYFQKSYSFISYLVFFFQSLIFFKSVNIMCFLPHLFFISGGNSFHTGSSDIVGLKNWE